jgi:hypothetical protein
MEQNELQNLSTILQVLSAILQTLIAFFTLIATIVLTVFVYKGTKTIASIEHSRSIRDAWLTIDSIALSNNEMLVVADDLMSNFKHTDEIDQKQKRWFALMVFNILISIFEGKEKQFLENDDAKKAFDQLLVPMLSDEDVYNLTQNRGHPLDFSKYCLNTGQKVIDI